jgi:hypothetical protein
LLAIALAMGVLHPQALKTHSATTTGVGVFKRKGLRKPLEKIMAMSWVKVSGVDGRYSTKNRTMK